MGVLSFAKALCQRKTCAISWQPCELEARAIAEERHDHVELSSPSTSTRYPAEVRAVDAEAKFKEKSRQGHLLSWDGLASVISKGSGSINTIQENLERDVQGASLGLA